jgi:CheY-specific phosphatase CheX
MLPDRPASSEGQVPSCDRPVPGSVEELADAGDDPGPGTGSPAGPNGPDARARPALSNTGPGTALFEAGELAARGEALSCNVGCVSAPGNALLTPACRGQVEALSKAVAEVLITFGVGEALCGQDSVGELAATTRDLTAVVDSQGGLGAAVVFGFDSGVARAVAGKVLAFMFEEAETLPAGEEDELVRRALGEVVSFALLGSLNTLGLPPEFPAPRFVRGRGVGLLREPRAVRSFAVTTESGEFEVGLAPGASLSQGVGPPEEMGPGAGRSSAEL